MTSEKGCAEGSCPQETYAVTITSMHEYDKIKCLHIKPKMTAF